MLDSSCYWYLASSRMGKFYLLPLRQRQYSLWLRLLRPLVVRVPVGHPAYRLALHPVVAFGLERFC
jgi:hypothetical protein